MSWKPAVKTIGNGDKWSYNALRFETKDEALASAKDLMGRWMLVVEYDAHESEDPVNYKLVDNDNGVDLVPTPVEKEEA